MSPPVQKKITALTNRLSQELRQLGLAPAISLVLGNIVGVGIFLTPIEVAKAAPQPWMYFGLWILGGLVAAAGAQIFAELGSLFPHAGGEYVFLDRAYGRPVAYAWGWMSLFIGFSGSIAALAVGVVETLSATPIGLWLAHDLCSLPRFGFLPHAVIRWGDLLALSLVWAATWVNCRSVTLTGRVQMILTWTPIGVFLLVGLATLFGLGSNGTAPATLTREVPWGNLSTAFFAVFFTYSGWNVLVYMGGEVHEPGRTIPRAILWALMAAMGLYMLLNTVFLGVIGLEKMSLVPNVGVATAAKLFGPVGATIFGIFLAMSISAGINVTTMAGSRISLAMARDGYLWQRMALLHPSWNTPHIALVVQGGVTTLLVLTGSFHLLVTLAGAVMLLLSCLTVSTLFVFRSRRGLRADYRAMGYPWLPLFFLVVGTSALVLGALNDGYSLALAVAIFMALVGLNRWRDRRLAQKQHPSRT